MLLSSTCIVKYQTATGARLGYCLSQSCTKTFYNNFWACAQRLSGQYHLVEPPLALTRMPVRTPYFNSDVNQSLTVSDTVVAVKLPSCDLSRNDILEPDLSSL